MRRPSREADARWPTASVVVICTTSHPVSMTAPWATARRSIGADDLGEAAAGVQDAVVEVEVAHQVVQARHAVGRSAEEHGRIAEDLPQPRVGEPALDVAGERAREQRRELTGAAQDDRVAQARRRLVGVVEEPRSPTARTRRRRSRGRRRAWRRRPARSLSNSAVAASRPDRTSVGGSGRSRPGSRVDAIGRVEADEVELLLGGRAEEPEEVVEHLGHQVPARAGVEPEAVAAPTIRRGRRSRRGPRGP